MRKSLIAVFIFISSIALFAQKNTVATPAGAKSLVITYKDGHQQTIPVSDISQIQFSSAAQPEYPGRFRGKWKVSTGQNGDTFFITLDNHGNATKSIGASHGTWQAVGDEAQITWDDGWHDAIRKVGRKYEKFAYEPGRSFDDNPSNVTDAVNVTPN